MQQKESQTKPNDKSKNNNPRKRRNCEMIEVICAACMDMDGVITKLKLASISFHYSSQSFQTSHNEYIKKYPNTKHYEIDKTGQPIKKKQKNSRSFCNHKK